MTPYLNIDIDLFAKYVQYINFYITTDITLDL